MLYHLLYPLSEQFSVFNIFRYITFRTAYAVITAMFIAFVIGPWIIKKLKKGQVTEAIKREGPATHQSKGGTPTMGGIIIISAVVVPTLLWADLSNRFIQLVLLATVWMGALGFLDDYLKVIKKVPKGMVGRQKIVGQMLFGILLGYILYLSPPTANFDTATGIPFLKNFYIELGVFYIPFVVLVVIASSNAVNLTDGLDGLAIGLVGICALAFAGISYLTGRVDFSRYLNIEYLPGAGELTVYCGTLMGAALGFLWYNSHPAQVFMGDTGSLALGAALGTLAILLKKELLLVLVGGVFVIEALSVIIQVGSYKFRKKRVFKMAPLHHHFELCGWAESKVVVRFWIAGMIFALLTLSTLKIR
ncbi:MAG: phospho-N-acetylmuramoyl-pentapeptide-transferase [candidate division Zixibacteria bacterium]|nr:phospho-N-acetylmuramoyl-pentapeptide-transferase [candidate division Zixibacteria bacterium]